jgi:transposase InsO family protein
MKPQADLDEADINAAVRVRSLPQN